MNIIEFITDVDCVKNDYVGGFSPFEKKIIEKYCLGKILHLFSGSSEIGDIRIDINSKSNATHKRDVFEYIKNNHELFDTILLDPIYCSEQRQEIWRDKYSKLGVERKLLYIFPYDTRRTKKLWNYFIKIHPQRIIIKSLNHYTISGYKLIKGYDIYPGAFKPNRCISIYESKNEDLNKYI